MRKHLFPNSNAAARRKTAGRLKWLFRLAKKDPDKVWQLFQHWYVWSNRMHMPFWIIDRFEGGEVYIHFFDYATDAIEDSLRTECRNRGFGFSARTTTDFRRARMLGVSKNGRMLAMLHNTSCSTRSEPFICVHVPEDADGIGMLVDLFRFSFRPDSLTFYARAYGRPLDWGGHSVRPGECGRYYL